MPAGLLEAIGGTFPVYAFQGVEDALFPRGASRPEVRRRSCFGSVGGRYSAQARVFL
jgi:hypothetical protein